jgi:hypothetical protein
VRRRAHDAISEASRTRYAHERPQRDYSIAGGEIRQIDGRQFVSLSNSRHRLLAAYEILGSSLRAAHDDDFAHIRDGRGRIQHQT